ncbi:pantothenate kinase [Kovacikia minuta CCNUW1]|uniref:pantothenate kinase n=1 Tax=Kovacikia minuta TaxID=2931930 RepID=UPI001CCEF6DD|nr:pantothenate kinase [Kovacikia minuta]UBF27812.1 pantothenate kinase [Kovacikia minuta CCNUW1]
MHETSPPRDAIWIALMIGNSRLHWAIFSGNQLQQTWNTPHLSQETAQQLKTNQFDLTILLPPHPSLPTPHSPLPLWIASVVPSQSVAWQEYPHAHFLTLEHVPLQGTYSTLGIDRALAVWGAISLVGSPALVIDAGTALTFTGADRNHQLVGGAILPGVQLQFRALSQGTAALSELPTPYTPHPTPLPPRWALNTHDAIASGVIHTLIASIRSFVEDWWQRFPDSTVILTGGDGDRLYDHIKQQVPALAARITVNPAILFEGIRAVRRRQAEGREQKGTGER